MAEVMQFVAAYELHYSDIHPLPLKGKESHKFFYFASAHGSFCSLAFQKDFLVHSLLFFMAIKQHDQLFVFYMKREMPISIINGVRFQVARNPNTKLRVDEIIEKRVIECRTIRRLDQLIYDFQSVVDRKEDLKKYTIRFSSGEAGDLTDHFANILLVFFAQKVGRISIKCNFDQLFVSSTRGVQLFFAYKIPDETATKLLFSFIDSLHGTSLAKNKLVNAIDHSKVQNFFSNLNHFDSFVPKCLESFFVRSSKLETLRVPATFDGLFDGLKKVSNFAIYDQIRDDDCQEVKNFIFRCKDILKLIDVPVNKNQQIVQCIAKNCKNLDKLLLRCDGDPLSTEEAAFHASRMRGLSFLSFQGEIKDYHKELIRSSLSSIEVVWKKNGDTSNCSEVELIP